MVCDVLVHDRHTRFICSECMPILQQNHVCCMVLKKTHRLETECALCTEHSKFVLFAPLTLSHVLSQLVPFVEHLNTFACFVPCLADLLDTPYCMHAIHCFFWRLQILATQQQLMKAKSDEESKGGGAADARRWNGLRNVVESRALLKTAFRTASTLKAQVTNNLYMISMLYKHC